MERHCDEFIGDMVHVDEISRPLMELWRPTGALVACTIQVEELFAQTPGPRCRRPPASRA